MTSDAKDKLVNRKSATQAFAYGLVAGFAMVIATIALRLMFDAFSITELAADWLTSFLPGEVLDFLLETLVFSAKPLMFAGLLIAQVVLGGLLGIVYRALYVWSPITSLGERSSAIIFSATIWLLSMAAPVPAFGGGVFGSQVQGGTVRFLAASLVAFGVYGLVIGLMFERNARQTDEQGYEIGRRSFLRRIAIWGVFAAVVVFSAQFVLGRFGGRLSPSGVTRTQGVLSTEITPNGEFYVVSKNIVDPQVSLPQWNLEVGGLVKSPFTLTFEGLQNMPFIEEFVTLECISNRVGGDLIGNAKWRGVPLKTILEEAGLGSDVVDISFKAWDGYTESIPLEMAMRDEVIVAYEMNGEPLSHKHGFPARLIIPGFFGLKSVKWLTAIEPVDHDFQGFWQERGWTDAPYVKTFSRFDIPQNRAVLFDDSIMLGGVAFAGIRGISNIEISDDGGQNWASVDHISEPISPYTWVIWTTEFRPIGRGNTVLRVRATDGEGNIQTSEIRPTLPDGASGQHEIQFDLRRRPDS